MRNLMFLLAAGFLLAACGGSNNTVSDASPSTGSTSPSTPETPAASVRDAFTSNIATVVSTAPEDAEPVAIDASDTGASENSEPASI